MENEHGSTVLLIEDRSEHPSAIRAMLDQLGSRVFQVAEVESVFDAERLLARNPVEAVVLDLGTTEARGLEAVRRVQIAAPHAAIVLLCASEDEPIAVQAIHQGAQDYLIKGQSKGRELKRGAPEVSWTILPLLLSNCRVGGDTPKTVLVKKPDSDSRRA